jgi:hypothetical protein
LEVSEIEMTMIQAQRTSMSEVVQGGGKMLVAQKFASTHPVVGIWIARLKK